MFDIQAVLVYGWIWKYYEKDTDEIMQNILAIDEIGEEEELHEKFQDFLYKKYGLTYGKAIPRREGEDDAVYYISFSCQNKERLIQSFSISKTLKPFSSILNVFELTSHAEIYTLVNVDFKLV